MGTTHKRWSALGVSALALGAAAGAQTADETVASDASAAAAAPASPSSSFTGEGEGGETGEGAGGEGGVNVAEASVDAAVYGAGLAIVEAHVLAARDAYAAGEAQAAAEMFAHPVSEVLADLAPVLTAQGVAPMDDLLLAASIGAFDGAPADTVAADAEAILAALSQARAAAPDDGAPEEAVAAQVAFDQISRAVDQYGAAAAAPEYEPYLDGYGFFAAARAAYDRHASAIAARSPEADTAIRNAFAVLETAYPSVERPAALNADESALFGARAALGFALAD